MQLKTDPTRRAFYSETHQICQEMPTLRNNTFIHCIVYKIELGKKDTIVAKRMQNEPNILPKTKSQLSTMTNAGRLVKSTCARVNCKLSRPSENGKIQSLAQLRKKYKIVSTSVKEGESLPK